MNPKFIKATLVPYVPDEWHRFGDCELYPSNNFIESKDQIKISLRIKDKYILDTPCLNISETQQILHHNNLESLNFDPSKIIYVSGLNHSEILKLIFATKTKYPTATIAAGKVTSPSVAIAYINAGASILVSDYSIDTYIQDVMLIRQCINGIRSNVKYLLKTDTFTYGNLINMIAAGADGVLSSSGLDKDVFKEAMFEKGYSSLESLMNDSFFRISK